MGATDDDGIFVDVVVMMVVLTVAGGCKASVVVVRSGRVVVSVVIVDCGVVVVVEVPGTVFVCTCPTVSAVVAVALPVLVMESEFAD